MYACIYSTIVLHVCTITLTLIACKYTYMQLVEIYGCEADKHLFRCLLSSVDLMADGRNTGKDGQQLQLLIQEANALITKPNFASILCYAFENQDNKVCS